MCLLAVLSRVHPDAPLVVGANRDESLARPAVAMALLATAPRVLGGRDLMAGGTWMAVNEHGVVAALTNRPTEGGRDPGRRSRGGLPLKLSRHQSAADAAAEFAATVSPADYNPCWLLVGDRRSLFYFDVGDGPLIAESLSPGLWVLENRPLRAASPKAQAVRAALADAAAWRGAELGLRLAAVLASHTIPEETELERRTPPRPPEVDAPCVHAGPYGTRSSAIVVVPTAEGALPVVEYSDGPPCTSAYFDAAGYWNAAVGSAR